MIGKTNAGAGGGHLNDTDALLRVSAPAHSIVTITKGSTTKSDHGHENADNHNLYDYYFIIHQSQFDSENFWTVTATYEANIVTTTIIIDTSDEYDVILSYRVPPEYQAVDYIETNATNQYLILDIDKSQPANTAFVNIIFQKVSTAGDSFYIFGNQASSPYFAAYMSSNGTTLGARASGNNFKTATVASAITEKRTLHFENGVFSYDGAAVITDSSSSVQSHNIALPGLASSNTAVGGTNYIRIYEAKFIIGNTTFELVPCYRRSDNIIGFWDRHNEVFRQSDGAGAFDVVGPDI